MKIRIKDNTIRFRLSEPEVERLAKGQPVAMHTAFPGEPLHVEVLPASETDLQLGHHNLLLRLSREEIAAWAHSEQVGISKEIIGSDAEKLELLVEKDFKCLTRRPEEEADLYPNPNKHHC